MSGRLLRALGAVAALTFMGPAHAQSPADADGDGVDDVQDCAPNDARLAAPHVYYWDLDGDQSGDSANTLTLCAVQPFNGSVAWGGDPDDSDNAVGAPIVPRGDRVLALDFADIAADGVWRPENARELGADAATFQLRWNAIELTPGSFTGPQASLVDWLPRTYGVEGFSVHLSINPIDGGVLALPPDIASGLEAGTLRLSDPAVIARFRNLLDFVKASLGDTPLVSLQIGHDVDRFLPVRFDIAFWSDYITFFQAAQAHARSLWGPALKVGVTATQPGLVTEPTASLMRVVNGAADVVSVSYVPGITSAGVPDPGQVRADVEQVIARYYPKPVVFAAVGYPSAPGAGSSDTRQAQFVGAFFQVWDAYAQLIPFASFLRLHDTDAGNAAVRSLGLRTRVDAGAGKSGYGTFRTATLNRGWWRVKAPASRPFLLGFTPALYDHNPGGAIIDSVLAETSQLIGAHGDLIAYHFDNGVPWTEALADTFAGPEPPYSANLRDVWARERAARPAGTKVAVAINPIGVPRNTLAPYWGVGEGFYHDDQFNLIGNGIVQDYESRLLPPPWHTYALDSPQVKTAFLNYARRTLDYFKPDYLITGIEVNLALQADPALFARYVELQRHVYTELRANPAYAHVKIVVSFAAEYFVSDEFGVPILIDALQQSGVEQRHLEGIQALLPYTDLVGLSVYPIKSRFGASLIQAGFFDDLFSSIRSVTDKPIAITEAGYPSATFRVRDLHFASDRDEQYRFLRLMLSESARHGIELVTNYSVRDQTPYLDKLRARSLETPPFIAPGLVEFYKYFEFIGLFDASGAAKAAAALFDSTLELPVSETGRFVPALTFSSPDGLVRATVGATADGHLTYSLERNGLTVLEPSPLGITVDSVDLGAGIIDISVESTTVIDGTYPTRGAHSTARNHANEITLEIQRTGTGDRAFRMAWRLYDEGLAFRYLIPGNGARTISGESSGWMIPQGSPVWHQLSTSNYEGLYFDFPIGHFDTSVGAPLTIELSTSAGYLTLTEGALREYSGMTYDADLGSRLIKAQFLDDATWQVSGGTVTPWRLAIVSPTLNGLVNADMTTSVSPPPDPALFPNGLRTGWIRPGKAVWSWWTDNESGADWELQKRYVDYATRLRAEYVTVDAWWETGFPTVTEDQFQRLGNLVAYAHTQQRFVGIWVWRSWFSMIDRSARRTFFQKARDAGAVGVKVDNLDDTRTESIANVRMYEEMLRDAAEFQLMLNFHGLHKPTGLERTYPNLMAQESGAGLEYTSVQWPIGGTIPVAHNATLPFVRFVAGPADYTPVTFDPRKIGESTFAHQMATAGVFTSAVLHYAEDPALLLAAQPVQDVLRTLPTLWDETIVLPESRIGQLAAMARRSGDRWYLFVLNGDAANGVSLQNLPLSFLGDRPYHATLIGDGTKTTFDRRQVNGLRRTDEIDVAMLPGGGFTAVFLPAPDASRRVGQGFSSIPPVNTGPGWQAGYGWIRDHGDIVAHSLQEGIPWPEALLSSDYRTFSSHLRGFWELMRSADNAAVPNHARYLMVNPIDALSYARLAPYHGDRDYMPLPAPWDTYAFDDPRVKTAMVNYLIAAIEFFQPEYVATSIEANILLANAPHKWAGFKALNAYLYTTIKQRYPDIKVFTTLHYEHMLGLAEESRTLALAVRNSYPNVLEAEVKELMRHSDYVAVSSYPFMMENNRYIGEDGRLDFDYFDRAFAIARELGKPVVFEQTGYISQNLFVADRGVTLPGSDAQQDDYLKLVLGVAHTENVDFVMNFVVGDYGTNYGEFPSVLTWSHIGLFRLDGTAKPALATWDAYRAEATAGVPIEPPPAPAPSGPASFDSFAALVADAARTGVPAGIDALETSPSPELFVRWQQFASLLPAFAVPPADDPTAPWALGEPYAAAARATLARRELFLPYLEPLFQDYARTGVFALRLLSPTGPPTFMLGDWVLLAPVVEEGASTRDVALPEGAWIDWYSGQSHLGGRTIVVNAPLDRVPLFIRSVHP